MINPLLILSKGIPSISLSLNPPIRPGQSSLGQKNPKILQNLKEKNQIQN
jgi:hypothetical protein